MVTPLFNTIAPHRASRRIARAAAASLLCSAAIAVAVQPAVAFELFGFKLFGSDEEEVDVVDPLHYTVTLEAPAAESGLTAKLNATSTLVTDAEEPVSGSLGLLSRARGDRERLVGALYEEARYDGVVDVLIAGQSIDDLPPDAQFGAGPVPVTIRVEPGKVFTLGEVALSGDAADLAPAEFGLAGGENAGSLNILQAEAEIVRRLKQEGRPLAKVAGRSIVADHPTGTLDVTIDVQAGPVAGYGETTVTGTESMDPDFTAYMAGLERGRTYSPQEIEDARERLVNLGAFGSVNLREGEALDADGNVPIAIEASERKLRYYGLGATVSNTEGLGIEGYWGHRNLFGRGEKLRVEGAISRIGESDGVGDLNYNAAIMFEKPGVVGPASRFFASTRVVYEHPDAYDRFTTKASVGLAYDLSKTQSVSGELAVDYSRITDAFNQDREFLIVSMPLQYVYDNRDNKLNPTKGFRLLAFAEPAYDTIAGNTFVKVRGEGSAYFSFDKDNKFILAGRLVGGSIFGAGLDDIPADRRFYSGGGGSVRGYAYQGVGPKDANGVPTGGLSYMEASAELRVAVYDNFGIVPFIDVGTVSDGQVPDFSDIKAGAGVGLRYLTPFGPLRLDAAVPLNPGPGDPDFGIYAGIGQSF
jgi:translocation and assembly module TamA